MQLLKCIIDEIPTYIVCYYYYIFTASDGAPPLYTPTAQPAGAQPYSPRYGGYPQQQATGYQPPPADNKPVSVDVVLRPVRTGSRTRVQPRLNSDRLCLYSICRDPVLANPG